MAGLFHEKESRQAQCSLPKLSNVWAPLLWDCCPNLATFNNHYCPGQTEIVFRLHCDTHTYQAEAWFQSDLYRWDLHKVHSRRDKAQVGKKTCVTQLWNTWELYLLGIPPASLTEPRQRLILFILQVRLFERTLQLKGRGVQGIQQQDLWEIDPLG